jgi:isocitrate lyase
MYKSPIELIELFELDPIHSMVEKAIKDVQKQQEEHIVQVIKQCGVNVDKDELIKALQYDRDQYNKGYKDGVREFAKQVSIEIQQALTNNYDVKKKRLEKGTAYNDEFIIIIDGKNSALIGIGSFIDELVEDMGVL